MPHYCIEYKNKEVGEEDEPTPLLPMRIVESKNQSRALAHVVEDTLTVRLAEPNDFVTLTKAGGEIEKAL